MTYNAEQITYMLAEVIGQNREYRSWHCSTQHLMALVERVVAEEREACAKVCDDYDVAEDVNTCDTAEGISIAIRARRQA
jgi:hypothetical protein